MQATTENRLAGRYLERVRGKTAQGAFAGELTRALKVPISQSALSGYEKGRRQVPAAVLLAASKLARQPIIADEQAGEDLLDWVAQRLEARAKARA